MTKVQHGHFESFANAALLKIDNIKGNFVPEQLKSIIVNKRGKPDRLSIDILSEIIYRYRPDKSGKAKFTGNAWQTSYAYLEKKFAEGREQIRRSLVKLEQLGFTIRELKTTSIGERLCCNTLFIHLNKKAVFNALSNNHNTKEKDVFLGHPQFVEISPQIGGDYIDKEDKKENNRSSVHAPALSNFLNESLEEEILNPDSNFSSEKRVGEGSPNTSNPKQKTHSKTLSSFYPLGDADCLTLQKLSRREFDLNAMNEILLSMSKKEGAGVRNFFSKKGFLSYMAKALIFEKRQAIEINNKSFRISNNKSSEERTRETQEKYLERIESSKDTSPLSQFKKKLASAFECGRAYTIIKALISASSVCGRYEITFSSNLRLSDTEEYIIKTHMLNTYKTNASDSIERVEITNLNQEDKVERAGLTRTNGSYSVNAQILQTTQENIPKTIWNMVRGALIKHYGSDIDKSWFSKLEPEVLDDLKSLNLRAPSDFIRNWIEREYSSSIASITRSLGFEFLGVERKNC